MGVEIRGLEEGEVEQHGELVFISYAHGRRLDPDSTPDRMLSEPDWWLRKAASMPDYRSEQTRVMVMGGRLVCSVTCYPRPSYVAGRIASAVCIGSVCTHPLHRRRGLLRQVLEEAVEWMKSQGVLWSFLGGDEAVYGSSGWKHLTAWSLRVDMPVRDEFGVSIRVRPVDAEADLPSLMAIYEQFSGALTGVTVRTESYWRDHILPPGEQPRYMLCERDGAPIGYFAGSDGAISEVGWTTACAEDVLAFLLRQWSGQPVWLPICSGQIIDALRRISAIRSQRQYHDNGASITMVEASQGLWQYHRDPAGIFPEFTDTAGLLRFLREHNYVMWIADRS